MESVAPLQPPEEELWRAFAQVLRVLPRQLERELKTSAHISTPEYVALASLSDNRPGGLSINELAERVGLSASRVSRLADMLVRGGEVHRQDSVRDGRSQRLTITEAGLTRLATAWPHQLASVRRHVLDHLDPADHQALARAFRAILAHHA